MNQDKLGKVVSYLMIAALFAWLVAGVLNSAATLRAKTVTITDSSVQVMCESYYDKR